MVRHEEARARAAATIARVDALLEETRNRPIPESLWELKPLPHPEPSRSVAQRTTPAAGSARLAAGVSKATLDQRLGALEEAIGKMMMAERLGWQRRAAEAERRLAEVEARLAQMEGRNG